MKKVGVLFGGLCGVFYLCTVRTKDKAYLPRRLPSEADVDIRRWVPEYMTELKTVYEQNLIGAGQLARAAADGLLPRESKTLI